MPEDIGPALAPRGELRAIANEAHQLVQILLHTTVAGGDLTRAQRTYEKLKALFGSNEPSAGG